MSCYQIYYKDGAKMMRPVLTREEYVGLRNSRKQVSCVRSVRKGNARMKNMLVQMNYSCIPGEDGLLKGCKTASTTVGMDIDWTPSPLPHEGEEQIEARKEEWLKMVPELVLSKKEELGLLMLERSATKGYHLVFRRRPELSQEDNLRWASNLLGVDYDEGAKDITRVFFTTTASEEDLLYLDDEIFKVEEMKNEENSKTENSKLTTDSTPPAPEHPKGVQELYTLNSQLEDASLKAFDLCVEQAGLKPDEMDVWGEHNWHNNLMAVLSVGVAKLMSRDQLEAVIRMRLSNYSQTEDCKKLIDYFYENYSADKGFMSASLRDINARAQEVSPRGDLEGASSDLDRLTKDWNPPQLPNKLPRLIQLLIKPFPEQYHPMLVVTACVVLGAIASHFRHPAEEETQRSVVCCL